MTFPIMAVSFLLVCGLLAGRWASALQKAHHIAAISLGLNDELNEPGIPVSGLLRLYALDGWLEQQFSLGLVSDPEAETWRRVARNRWWLLLVSVTFSAPPLLLSLVVGAQGSRVPALPALPIAILAWLAATAVASFLLRGDSRHDPRRLLMILGLVAACNGIVLAAAIVLPRR